MKRLKSKVPPRAPLMKLEHADGYVQFPALTHLLDIDAPAGKYLVDALLDDWPTPADGGDKLRALRNAASLAAQTGTSLGSISGALHEKAEAAARLQEHMAELERAARVLARFPVDIPAGGFETEFDWSTVDGDGDANDVLRQLYEERRFELQDIADMAKTLHLTISSFNRRNKIRNYSLGRSKPVERAFVYWCKAHIRILFGVDPSTSRAGPFVRFAQAAWTDTDMPETDGIDDTLANYCGLPD